MDKQAFKERMKSLKSYRELNPDKGYWDWKVLAFDGGGEIIGPPTEKEMLSESKIKKLTEYEDEDFDLNDRISVMKDIIISKIQKKVNDNTAMTMASYNNASDKFSTPFVKNKKLKLTNAEHLTGAVLSENLLDSLHKYANIVGIPLEEAVGLAAQETTFGKYKGYMRGQNDMFYYDVEKLGGYGAPKEILNDHSYHNDFFYDVPYEVYAAFLRKHPKESYDQLRLRTAKELETNSNYYINKGVKKYLSVLNPWVHALELYKSGKYNTGDKSHTQDVKRAGNLVLQDPALREWKSKNSIPAYTDGTGGDSGVELMGEKEIQWFKDWYNKRMEYAIANNRPDVVKQLESLQYYFYPEPYKYSLGVPWDNSIYTSTLEPKINRTKISINDQAIKDYEKEHGIKIGGYLHPAEGIVLPSNYSSSDLLHELAHIFNSSESVTNAVNTAISDENGFVSFSKGLQNSEYWISPWEVHSRLMQFRKENNIDPIKVYNEEDIKQLRKSAKDETLFEIFDDSQMMHLLNDVAYNATTSTDDRLFLKNGGVVPAYSDGTGGNDEKLYIGRTDQDYYGNLTHNIVVDADGNEVNFGLPDIVITPKNNLSLGTYNYNEEVARNVADIVSFVPGVGEVIDATVAAQDASKGDYTTAAGLGLGLFIPNVIEKPLKWLWKGGKGFVRNLWKSKTKDPFNFNIEFEPIKPDPMSLEAKPISSETKYDVHAENNYLDYGFVQTEPDLFKPVPDWMKDVIEFYNKDVATREHKYDRNIYRFISSQRYKQTFNETNPIQVIEPIEDTKLGGYFDGKHTVVIRKPHRVRKNFDPDVVVVHEGAHKDQDEYFNNLVDNMSETELLITNLETSLNIQYASDMTYPADQKKLLNEAYSFHKEPDRPLHYLMEKGASNREMRYVLWKENGKPNVEELNKIIDNMSDDDLSYLLSQENAYTASFWGHIKQSVDAQNRHVALNKIRDALKYVPFLTIPILLNAAGEQE